MKTNQNYLNQKLKFICEFNSIFNKKLLIFLLLFKISNVFADCDASNTPVILGPISQCNALNQSSCNYYLQNPTTGTYVWTCVGGTVTPSGSTASVQWLSGQSVYSLSVLHYDNSPEDGCTGIIFLNDCDCSGPDGGMDQTVVDLDEVNFTGGHIPTLQDLQAIAQTIDPSGTHASIGTFGTFQWIFVHDESLFIRGIFNFPHVAFYFQKCTLNMDLGSIIYTANANGQLFGFKVDGQSVIQGTCDNMWQGIRIGPEGVVRIENSSLSDAEFGIELNIKMHLYLINAFFSKNYVCVYAPLSSSANTFNGLVENSIFEGGQPLLPGRYHLQSYHGQYGQSGLQPSPQQNVSFAAMEFNDLVVNVAPFSIPFSLAPGTVNIFQNFNMGIMGNLSDIDVFNCHFENIDNAGVYNYYGNYNGCAIYAQYPHTGFFGATNCLVGDYNNSTETKSNTFLNTLNSVLIQGDIGSKIIGNQIDNNTYCAIQIRRSVGQTHTIDGNIINSSRYGIYSNLNTHSTINITNNNPVNSFNNGSPNQSGIVVSDVSGAPCIANVINNTVNCYATHGIYGANNQGSTYQNNVVTMDYTNLDPAYKHIYGIALDGGSNNTVNCNYSGGPINGQTYLTRFGRSFYNSLSSGNIFKSNQADFNMYCFEFVSACPSTQFYGNSLFTSDEGILLGDHFTGVASDMGTQGLVAGTNYSPGNLFYGVSGGNFGLSATMTVNSSPPAGSLWANSGNYYPQTNSTTGGTPIQPYNAIGYTPYVSQDCGVGGGGGGGGSMQSEDELIATNTIVPASIDEEVLKYDMEKKLYEKLLQDSTPMDSSIILQNFMDSTQYNNKGKFGDISNTLGIITDEKISGASDVLIQADIDATQTKNDGVVANADYEVAQKEINTILLNSIMKNRWEFTTTETSTIMSVANSCPYISGPAVYDARALAKFINIELTFDDEDICTSSLSQRKRHIQNKTENQISASIYPNPADNMVTIKTTISENEKGEFVLFNSLGINVYDRSIENAGKLIDMDIHSLSNGIYSCHLIVNNCDKVVGKLTVVH